MLPAILASLISVSSVATQGPEALLLGVSEGESLATYLVDAAGVHRLGRGLAVPRASGWWVVDVSPGDMQEVYARPASAGSPAWWKDAPASDAEADATPPTTAPEAAPAQDEGGDQTPFGRDCETRQTNTITFAGPDFVSVQGGFYSDCGAHPTYGSDPAVLRLASDGGRASTVDISEIYGKEAAARITRIGEKAAEGQECIGGPRESEWWIARKRGGWEARGLLPSAAEACRGNEADYLTDVPLPAQITGPERAVDLDALAKRYPDLLDALASPSGNMVVLVTKAGISVLVAGKKVAGMDEQLTATPVVLAQWATGKRNVERWRREAAEALRPR